MKFTLLNYNIFRDKCGGVFGDDEQIEREMTQRAKGAKQRLIDMSPEQCILKVTTYETKR